MVGMQRNGFLHITGAAWTRAQCRKMLVIVSRTLSSERVPAGTRYLHARELEGVDGFACRFTMDLAKLWSGPAK